LRHLIVSNRACFADAVGADDLLSLPAFLTASTAKRHAIIVGADSHEVGMLAQDAGTLRAVMRSHRWLARNQLGLGYF
jgi:hypothetical protein